MRTEVKANCGDRGNAVMACLTFDSVVLLFFVYLLLVAGSANRGGGGELD